MYNYCNRTVRDKSVLPQDIVPHGARAHLHAKIKAKTSLEYNTRFYLLTIMFERYSGSYFIC